MGRAPCCDKENVKRGPWSAEEDAKLKGFIDKYGTGGNWIALPHKADKIICGLYANIGSRWSIIAGQLPGRTDNDVKNYWNTKLKKKLLATMLQSFQEKPSFYPSLPFQSPTPYRSDLFLTTNSSPFYTHTTPNFMNLTNNTTLVQDQIITHLSPPPDSSLLISNNNDNSFFLGFQDDHGSMYSNPMEYDHCPTSDVKLKEAMLMFGSGGGGYEVMSTTGSSSEGGSCLSQISYVNCSKNHHKKQEDRFSLQGFGDQSHSFIINHNCTEQEPKGYHLNLRK
ncbi:hypothetical protein L1987_75716 [Smallanthus sonchifolius]|uniref:Uncharacterized protein n=1 Tax=Smallanthus sonchifolius TaxID=185202 RepID=A0ACB9A6I0_9ASTR|nr:hypothetical protein L1987_75716 [Smallanthus sonchifolius]